ncbi:hypothetical protein DY000_02058987 [Brassica cretica]|uniref:Uncharacterized protein n=1 Tax=Brassica cretica TaxID=69181 RepID=A0ABQ7AQZ5_BRACR|nr:hypothetical protein DY000_02058987 [Brassica cretica]
MAGMSYNTDEVVVVDLEFNQITTSEEIPPIILSSRALKALANLGERIMTFNSETVSIHQPATGAYGMLTIHIFTVTAFDNSTCFLSIIIICMLVQFLGSFAFLDYLERRLGSDENSTNLLEKLQDAVGRGHDAMSFLPKSSMEPEIITIAEPEVEEPATRYTYDRFPANVRSEEQEEKRKQILAAASGALESNGRHSPSSPPGKNTKEGSFSSRERAVSVACNLVAHA